MPAVAEGSEPVAEELYERSGNPELGVAVSTFGELLERHAGAEFSGPQSQAFDLLMFVSGGQAEQVVDFARYRLSAGDVLWVRAGQVLEWGDIGGLAGDVVTFSPFSIPPITWETVCRRAGNQNHWLGAATASPDVASGIAFIRSIAEKMRTQPSNAWRVALPQAVSALLLTLTVNSDFICRSDVSSAQLSAYLSFLDALEVEFTTRQTAQEYAELLGYSTKTLDRMARRYAGRSVKQMIDDRVMLEAKRLLVHSDLSVAAIGRRLGNADAGNFARFFAHHAEVSPAEFRRTHGLPSRVPTPAVGTVRE